MNDIKAPQSNSRAALLAVAAAFLVGLTGCGRSAADASQSKTESNAPQLVDVGGVAVVKMDPDSEKLAGITVVPVSSDRLTATMQPTGEVSATDSGTVLVTSRLPGKITDALVSVGDRVRKGQTIAWVDSVDLANAEVAYQTAVSHANLTRHQLDQQRKLAGYGSLSEQPVEDARKASSGADASVAGDEAQLKVDRLALESTRKLVDMGEITRKPMEDAQNAFAQAQASATQAGVTLHSAKANLDRAKILYDGGVYSLQQFEDADAAHNSALAGLDQAKTAERLANEELSRQQTIFKQNLNGAASLQAAQSKVQQDEHGYQNDLIAQGLAHAQYQRALTVRKSGIPISQALQQAQDAFDSALIAEQGAANTLKLYGVQPGSSGAGLNGARVVIPIVSPIDGLVAARTMVVGQNIDTSTALVRLVNLDRVYIDAQVFEGDFVGVRVGDSVQVHVSAFPNRTFTGTVKYVAREVSPDTRTVTVRTVLENPGWALNPGMFATVLIGSRNSSRSIAVPADAILTEGDKQVAYVMIAPGEFVKRSLKVGNPVGGRIPVVDGLAVGDRVVVGGNVLIERAQEQLETGKKGS